MVLAPKTDPHTGYDLPSVGDDPIDGRIGVHDSHQFEVKLDYSIDPQRKDNRYEVEAFFFVPRSLGVNGDTYAREQFYSDVQAYIRFKTPSQPLREILDRDNRRSPLTRILKVIDKIEGDRPRKQRRAAYELRMLGCLVRVDVRDRADQIRQSLRQMAKQGELPPVLLDDARTACAELLADATATTEQLRELRTEFQKPGVPDWVRESFEYADEYVSLVLEYYLTRLLEVIDKHPALRARLGELRRTLVETVVREIDYRQGAKYVTRHDDKPEENESFEYRRSLLKKFVSSVLFLEISKKEDGSRATNLAAAGAAAVAMLFAALVAIFAQSYYGVNTAPFVLALVVSYIFKDRIKEWLRYYFRSKMSRFMSDFDSKIHDPMSDEIIGRCRETFGFLSEDRVPRDVLAFRHRDASSVVETQSKPEVCFFYGKQIRIRGDKIDASHGRVRDINDIIRFSVATFLGRTDDAVKPWRRYNRDQDALETVDLPKVYHLNVVFRLRAPDKPGAIAMERVRVVLNRAGIVRLEEVR